MTINISYRYANPGCREEISKSNQDKASDTRHSKVFVKLNNHSSVPEM